MKVLLTGGAGFIGSALVRHLIRETDYQVINLDALTYAANLASLSSVEDSDRYIFERGDIRDADRVASLLAHHQPDAIMHLAAESHVDRSIDAPDDFISTNIQGTSTLLEQARTYLHRHPGKQATFRFVHISTDEVFGDLAPDAPPFTETTAYAPSSPYAASKAASDHLVRAWHRTYGLPTLISNCSNNYGPHQFPEKLVPHMLLNALQGKPLPVYGDGQQIRDWLYVDDHARALVRILEQGQPGRTYAVGGHNELSNLELVNLLCELLDELKPDPAGSYRRLITHVPDRPGHDRRYAIDASRISAELGWRPAETPASGLRKTVRWYLDNPDWWQPILDGRYQLERLGQKA